MIFIKTLITFALLVAVDAHASLLRASSAPSAAQTPDTPPADATTPDSTGSDSNAVAAAAGAGTETTSSEAAECICEDQEDATGIVGRPLTPVSVAGVARRTYRRNNYYRKLAVGRPLTPVSVAGVARRTYRRNNYYRRLDDGTCDCAQPGDEGYSTPPEGYSDAIDDISASSSSSIDTSAMEPLSVTGHPLTLSAAPVSESKDATEVVGRPLTPVSVAGIAHHTSHRVERRHPDGTVYYETVYTRNLRGM